MSDIGPNPCARIPGVHQSLATGCPGKGETSAGGSAAQATPGLPEVKPLDPPSAGAIRPGCGHLPGGGLAPAPRPGGMGRGVPARMPFPTGMHRPAGPSPPSRGSGRTGGASSCRPSTTSSTTRLRCSSTPARPTATTGGSGACTSFRPRTGWTAATRQRPSGEPSPGPCAGPALGGAGTA